MVQPSGRGKNGDQVELGQEELDEELLVEVHNYQQPVAQGVVRAAELLQVSAALSIKQLAATRLMIAMVKFCRHCARQHSTELRWI